ncbi:hypothetical protein C3743_04570 [Burkholderia contaminans]|uniref:Uncharacterized protein n=1 Tax=Burkholderia contaminans TaxID=488447 RepID=A0A2S5E3D8_9BURK|nr:hypothetical protein C3743_04570 [Burkholderia contaminans]
MTEYARKQNARHQRTHMCASAMRAETGARESSRAPEPALSSDDFTCVTGRYVVSLRPNP